LGRKNSLITLFQAANKVSKRSSTEPPIGYLVEFVEKIAIGHAIDELASHLSERDATQRRLDMHDEAIIKSLTNRLFAAQESTRKEVKDVSVLHELIAALRFASVSLGVHLVKVSEELRQDRIRYETGELSKPSTPNTKTVAMNRRMQGHRPQTSQKEGKVKFNYQDVEGDYAA
jgi:hypothetical protein